jgi:uncharacterized protein with NRDE domain
LWLAANRDERLDRPWDSPSVLVRQPLVFGGRDLVCGGSWLAVNVTAGFVVGVTNAELGAPPGVRSRGQLVLAIAATVSLPDAVRLLDELDLTSYGAFNAIVVDAATGWRATNMPAPSVAPTDEPVIALGNESLEQPGERVSAAARRVAPLAGDSDEELLSALQALLADHEGADPLCRHGKRYGTVCSTILTLRGPTLMRYLFAAGPPCTTPFEPTSLPLI